MLENSTTASADMAAQMRKSLLNRLKVLRSTLIELGFKFIETFEKKGGEGLNKLTEAIRKFDPTALINTMQRFIKIFSVMFKVLKPLIPVILSAAVAWNVYKAGMFVAAAAQMALNAAMTANPIGLIITAIGVAVGLLTLLIIHWDLVKRKTVEFFDLLKGLILPIAAPFILWFEALREIARSWDDIKAAFRSGGFITGIKAIGAAILQGIVNPIQSLFGLLSKIPGVGKVFGGISNALPESTTGGAGPISPAERSSLIREEKISRGEVTIRDETGRAEVTGAPKQESFQLKLARSGGF
jgi:hypothetical protein